MKIVNIFDAFDLFEMMADVGEREAARSAFEQNIQVS